MVTYFCIVIGDSTPIETRKRSRHLFVSTLCNGKRPNLPPEQINNNPPPPTQPNYSARYVIISRPPRVGVRRNWKHRCLPYHLTLAGGVIDGGVGSQAGTKEFAFLEARRTEPKDGHLAPKAAKEHNSLLILAQGMTDESCWEQFLSPGIRKFGLTRVTGVWN